MRASVAFFLLTLVSVALLEGCGNGRGDDAKPPQEIVSSWSQALNAGDDEAAADLFADGAVVIVDQRTTLENHEDALAFNASLPCGGRVVKQSLDGDKVTATFTLTRRPGHMCDSTGTSMVIVLRVEDGKITLWHALPSDDASTETA